MYADRALSAGEDASVDGSAGEEASVDGSAGEEASVDGSAGEEASVDGSAGEEASVDGLSLVRDSLLKSGLSEQSTSMILLSWRVSTEKQYISYLHRWDL